jgi:hypothetical protein
MNQVIGAIPMFGISRPRRLRLDVYLYLSSR